jgi:hypothetical protein
MNVVVAGLTSLTAAAGEAAAGAGFGAGLWAIAGAAVRIAARNAAL